MQIANYKDGCFLAYHGFKIFSLTPKEVHDMMERGDPVGVSMSASRETCQMLEDNIYHAYVNYDTLQIMFCVCVITRGRLKFFKPDCIYQGDSVTDIIKYKRLNKLTLGAEL